MLTSGQIYILPIPLIRTLKLARGQKKGLISIFALGAFVIAASIVRMVMLRSSAKTTDPTWGSTMALIWTEVEANTSVICCCLPALRVPFLNLWHTMRGNSRVAASKESHVPGPNTNDYGWSGNEQSRVYVRHSPDAGNSFQSHTDGEDDGPQPANTDPLNSWYDKVLKNVDKEYDSSQSGSRPDAALQAGRDAPPQLHTGGIYKTTDVHVSTRE